jgi:hypothetical protein
MDAEMSQKKKKKSPGPFNPEQFILLTSGSSKLLYQHFRLAVVSGQEPNICGGKKTSITDNPWGRQTPSTSQLTQLDTQHSKH